jgi:hypothetical protein
MTKQVSLNDIYAVVNRLEDKMDQRMCAIEKRVDILEDFKGRVLGMAMVLAAFTAAAVDWIWKKITA